MKSNNSDVIRHYDLLIAENNDPVRDPKPLKDYMDKWDGQVFIDKMKLDKPIVQWMVAVRFANARILLHTFQSAKNVRRRTRFRKDWL